MDLDDIHWPQFSFLVMHPGSPSLFLVEGQLAPICQLWPEVSLDLLKGSIMLTQSLLSDSTHHTSVKSFWLPWLPNVDLYHYLYAGISHPVALRNKGRILNLRIKAGHCLSCLTSNNFPLALSSCSLSFCVEYFLQHLPFPLSLSLSHAHTLFFPYKTPTLLRAHIDVICLKSPPGPVGLPFYRSFSTFRTMLFCFGPVYHSELSLPVLPCTVWELCPSYP